MGYDQRSGHPERFLYQASNSFGVAIRATVNSRRPPLGTVRRIGGGGVGSGNNT